MKSLGPIIVFLISFFSVLTNDINFIITIKHSDYNEIKFKLEILDTRNNYVIEYRDIFGEVISIDAASDVFLPNIAYINGYASFVITDNKVIFEKVLIRYNNENSYLNYYNKEIFFKPYFISSEKVKINNNIGSRLIWDDPYQVYELKKYYFDINELLSLKYFDMPFINEIYLVIEKPRNYYKYLVYDEYLFGYKIPLNYELINEKVSLFFKKNLFYEISSFQPSLSYKHGLESTKGIYILKDETNPFLKINIFIAFSNIKIKIPLEIYANFLTINQKGNISIFDSSSYEQDKVNYE